MGVHGDQRQFAGVAILSSMWVPSIEVDCQAWRQAPLPTESVHAEPSLLWGISRQSVPFYGLQ